MRARGSIVVAVVAVVCVLGGGSSAQPARPQPPARATPVRPVVVELFTAQGCQGCPDANRAIQTLAEEPGVIALTYAVGYWDYLGWTDTFARPEFAQRQRDYQPVLHLRNVYTPQVVIDGRRQVSGADAPKVQTAIDEEASQRAWPPEVEFRESGDAVGVGSGRPPAGGAEVWAVAYVPGPVTVEVLDGDNRGQSVPHVNVVRRLTRLGDWSGRPMLYPLPDDLADDEAVVVLVQSKRDRRILTAATTAQP